jgi:hypothetical protein
MVIYGDYPRVNSYVHLLKIPGFPEDLRMADNPHLCLREKPHGNPLELVTILIFRQSHINNMITYTLWLFNIAMENAPFL